MADNNKLFSWAVGILEQHGFEVVQSAFGIAKISIEKTEGGKCTIRMIHMQQGDEHCEYCGGRGHYALVCPSAKSS